MPALREKIFLITWLLCAALPAKAQIQHPGWKILADTKFKAQYFKQYQESFLVPTFGAELKAHEGKLFRIRGYVIPLELEEGHTVIISRYPNASCFFCGGAGPESVVEVVLKEKPPAFKMDQIVVVEGILTLNAVDVEHMNFILKDARLVGP